MRVLFIDVRPAGIAYRRGARSNNYAYALCAYARYAFVKFKNELPTCAYVFVNSLD